MGTDQGETGPQTQFNAAVSVIQSLPKSGSYRPSHEEMLRFYSFYKQAMAGPCSIPRPGFWDPIGRYKWDAWNRLGRMSREDAMRAYISEMKKVAQKILDTVPLDDASPEMFEPFRPLYEMIPDMPRPPDSFFQVSPESVAPREEEEEDGQLESLELRDTQTEFSESRKRQTSDMEQRHPGQEEVETRRDPVGQASLPAHEEAKRAQRWGAEAEDFRDTLEQLEQDCNSAESWIHPHLFQPSPDVIVPASKSPDGRQGGNVQRTECYTGTVVQPAVDPWLGHPNTICSSDTSSGSESRYQLSPQIMATVQALQASIQGLCLRIESLERVLQEQGLDKLPEGPHRRKPWHSRLVPSRTLLLILVWPFFVHWLLRRFYGRKR